MPLVMNLIPLGDPVTMDDDGMMVSNRGPQYLKFYDPDAMGGIGHVVRTADISQAKRFPDAKSLFDEWKRTSTVRPVRSDGKPNRPLTAYSMTPVTVDE